MISKILTVITMALAYFGAPAATSDAWQAGEHYAHVDEHGVMSLWIESNGKPGLQSEPLVVLGKVVLPADTRLSL